jgi:hypothetical protein
MNQTKPNAHTSQIKKPWTTPEIQSIELNSAKNGVNTHGDGPGGGKS